MKLKTAVISLATLAAVCAFAPGGASAAMPNGLPHPEKLSNIDQVRWVCNPWGRCWWRPNFYGAYGYYGGPRFYHRPWGYGWHRGWRHWY
jgi:hypothetical protein